MTLAYVHRADTKSHEPVTWALDGVRSRVVALGDSLSSLIQSVRPSGHRCAALRLASNARARRRDIFAATGFTGTGCPPGRRDTYLASGSGKTYRWPKCNRKSASPASTSISWYSLGSDARTARRSCGGSPPSVPFGDQSRPHVAASTSPRPTLLEIPEGCRSDGTVALEAPIAEISHSDDFTLFSPFGVSSALKDGGAYLALFQGWYLAGRLGAEPPGSC